MGKLARTAKSKLHIKPGFTIIEVILVLAITASLFSGLMIGVGSAIARQRYRDSVQDFAEFLRRTYSSVLTPRNPRKHQAGSNDYCGFYDGNNPPDLKVETNDSPDRDGVMKRAGLPGRTNCVFYGKLVQFSDTDALAYDVVGKDIYAKDEDGNPIIESAIKETLKDSGDFFKNEKLKLNFFTLVHHTEDGKNCHSIPLGSSVKYNLQWQATVSGPARDDNGWLNGAVMLIMRSPITGRIHTYTGMSSVNSGVLDQYAKDISDIDKENDCSAVHGKIKSFFTANTGDITAAISGATELIGDNKIAFCVNSPDLTASGKIPRAVVINAGTGNTSDIEIIPQDAEDNPCKPKDP